MPCIAAVGFPRPLAPPWRGKSICSPRAKCKHAEHPGSWPLGAFSRCRLGGRSVGRELGPQAAWNSEGQCLCPALGKRGEKEGKPAQRYHWDCVVHGATSGRSRQKPSDSNRSAWSKVVSVCASGCAFRQLSLVSPGLRHKKWLSRLLLLRLFLRGHHGAGAVIDSNDSGEWLVPRLSAKTSCPRWRPVLPGRSNSANHTCPRVTPPATSDTWEETDKMF